MVGAVVVSAKIPDGLLFHKSHSWSIVADKMLDDSLLRDMPAAKCSRSLQQVIEVEGDECHRFCSDFYSDFSLIILNFV